jgi:hypothetical protein
MAVTIIIKRLRHQVTVPLYDEVCSAAITGTYTPGGFTWLPLNTNAGSGTSPLPSSAIYSADFYGSNGYNYQTNFTGIAPNVTATTKIFTSGGTELTAIAVPDATAIIIMLKSR